MSTIICAVWIVCGNAGENIHSGTPRSDTNVPNAGTLVSDPGVPTHQISPRTFSTNIHPVSVTDERSVAMTTMLELNTSSLPIFFAIM